MKSLADRPWMKLLSDQLAVILSIVFGLQLLRLLFLSLVGYVRDSLGVSALELAPWAVAIFALSLLAAPLNRLFGASRSLSYLLMGLALVRLAEQIIRTPQLDLILSVIGTVFFLWLIAFLVARASQSNSGPELATAFFLGLSIDTAVFVAFDTLDLSWQAGAIPLGIVLILVGVTLQRTRSIAPDFSTMALSWRQSASLLAIGPWIVLQLLVFQNIGYFGSQIGLEAFSAGALVLAFNALALLLLPAATGALSGPLPSAISILLLAIALFALPSANGVAALLLLLAGSLLAFFAFSRIVGNMTASDKEGMAALSTMLGIGMIVFILAAFIYYATYDINFGIRSSVVPPVLALLILIANLFTGAPASDRKVSPALQAAWIPVALLVLIPAAKWVLRSTPPEYASNTSSVRVINYNLHNAVNTSGELDPEALAQVIEASGAEIVALQEVSRGWLTWGSLDMLTWFAQRLDMHYVWGPTADAQWGNAILSRFPIKGYTLEQLPPEDVLLLRGYIAANIDVGGNSLKIIDTHFSHRGDQGAERLQQASAILEGWGQSAVTVIMGDLNAEPDTPEIRLLIDHGLVDISAEIGQQPTYTYHADNPDHQIDYILVSPDLGFVDFEIIQTSASDHLPLVVTIELGN